MNIKLENISKVIKYNTILKDITLEMDSGYIYGFVGTNGSGKTMLMRMICGLVSFSDGQYLVNGQNVVFGKKLYFNMGVIIEKPEFFRELTGLENLELLAKIKNAIKKDDIIRALNRVGLDPNNKKKVKEYSLGMKQRLGIAQAIMENPDILILDEPFNALDKETVLNIQSEILSEKKKGKTILLTSHDERNISLLCDTVFEMESGKIIGKRDIQ